jgi:hypothetical protein
MRQDLLSILRPSPSLLAHHSTAAAEHRRSGAPPPPPPLAADLLLRRDSLSSEPLVSFPSFPSSRRAFLRPNPRPGAPYGLLRRAPPAVSRRRGCLCGTWAVRSRRAVQIKRDRVPLGSVHRGPVDRVHSRGPRACVTARVSMTSACVSTANRNPPRGATAAYPPSALAGLQISPPFLEITSIPFHHIKPLQFSP